MGMHRSAISTSSAPAAIGPYSQGIQAEGRFLFVSGQGGIVPGQPFEKGPIEVQATQTLNNIRAILEAAGLTMAHVVKTTIFLTSMESFAAVNGVYKEYFEGEPPARSTVAVAALPLGFDVEIEAIAVY